MSETQFDGPRLGCIADDITGATDLAINLVKGGMRVVQVMEILPAEQIRKLDCDAVVVALKIRSVPAEDAVQLARAVMSSLQEAGCERFLYKYCSTFDSTDEGNIGPIAEALLEMSQQQQTVFCPAFPDAGRTVYQSHLFVGDRLLNESGMENHPLNPMKDADLRRVLGKQTSHKVGAVMSSSIEAGASEVASRLRQLAVEDCPFVIVDACVDKHLEVLATAVADMKLVTGGSGIARYLPEAYRRSGVIEATKFTPESPAATGPAFILSGSCSSATQRQVAKMSQTTPSLAIDVENAVSDQLAEVQRIIDWARGEQNAPVRMVYSTAAPEQVDQLQAQYGRQAVADAIESTLALVAQRIVVDMQIRCIVVAGGETSGAIANGLGITALRIGAEICPGVPWTMTSDPVELALAFKSGNFGSDDFFQEALEMLR